MRILNLHGLYGSPNNSNYEVISDFYKDRDDVSIISPKIHFTRNPIDILNQLSQPHDIIIGNSFGGFFAYILGEKYQSKTILTNPCIPAHLYISKLVPNYKYTEELHQLWDKYKNTNRNCHVLLGNSDNVLDTSITLSNLRGDVDITMISGGHKLTGPEYETWIKEQLL